MDLTHGLSYDKTLASGTSQEPVNLGIVPLRDHLTMQRYLKWDNIATTHLILSLITLDVSVLCNRLIIGLSCDKTLTSSWHLFRDSNDVSIGIHGICCMLFPYMLYPGAILYAMFGLRV